MLLEEPWELGMAGKSTRLGKELEMIRRLNKAGLVCFMELLLQLYQQELQQVLLHF